MTEATVEVAALFDSAFGGECAGLWGAPGGLNISGEHYDGNDGLSLYITLDRLVILALAPRFDGMIGLATTLIPGRVVMDLDSPAVRSMTGWSAYPVNIARAIESRLLRRLPGFNLAVDSTIPAGAGISSSVVLQIALATALNDMFQLGFSRDALVSIARQADRATREDEETGSHIFAASAFGQTHSAVLLDSRSTDVEHLPLHLEQSGLVLAIVDIKTKCSHVSDHYQQERIHADLARAQLGVSTLRDVSIEDLRDASRRLDRCTFRYVEHFVLEQDRVLRSVSALKRGDLSELGELMSASVNARTENDCPQLSIVLDAAQEANALGARIASKRYTQTVAILVPAASASELQEELLARFRAKGWIQPEIIVTRTYGGLPVRPPRTPDVRAAQTPDLSFPARATLHHVAARAGVSYQTVSRAINHPETVSSLTLARVQEAITFLRYLPNEHARALRRPL